MKDFDIGERARKWGERPPETRKEMLENLDAAVAAGKRIQEDREHPERAEKLRRTLEDANT